MDQVKAPFKPLSDAANILGGQTAVARICASATGRQIKQGHVSNWLTRDYSVPPDCAQAIEAATKAAGREVRREKLCPNFAWHLFDGRAA